MRSNDKAETFSWWEFNSTALSLDLFLMLTHKDERFRDPTDLPWEERKKIADHELYEISNWGRLKNTATWKLRRFSIPPKGYVSVTLSKYPYRIHRLVAQAFIPNPESKACVDHINNCPYDNRLENLQRATVKENNKKAYATDQKKSPVGQCVAQLTLEWDLVKVRESISEAWEQMGHREYISDAIRGLRTDAFGYKWIRVSRSFHQLYRLQTEQDKSEL